MSTKTISIEILKHSVFKNRFALVLLTLSVLISGCRKDDEPEDGDGPNVYIMNEGNFQAGNASVTLIQTGNEVVTQNYFQQQNNTALGDVGFSIASDENNYYLVVNNSNKIVVVDKNDFKMQGEIDNLSSPRYILKTGTGKAYVSDLFLGGVYVVDLNSKTISSEIMTGGWTEKMLLHDGTLYVTNLSSENIYAIDTQTDVISDSIHLGCLSGEIIKDSDGNLWVLCPGSSWEETDGHLFKIDPSNNQIVADFPFDGISGISNLHYLAGSNELVFTASNVYKMKTDASALPVQHFIPASDRSIYGLFVNPDNGEFWLLDAKDFASQGEALVYDKDGVLITSYTTGISPTYVYFE